MALFGKKKEDEVKTSKEEPVKTKLNEEETGKVSGGGLKDVQITPTHDITDDIKNNV